MLRLMVRVALTLAPVLLLIIAVIRVGYGRAHPLLERDVLLSPDCENPCWLGIEMGKAPLDDMRIVTDNWLGRDVDVPPHLARAAEAMPQMFIEVEPGRRFGLSHGIRDGVIADIRIPYKPCPGAVLAQLGAPDEAYFHSQFGPEWHYNAGFSVTYREDFGYFEVELRRPGPSNVNTRSTRIRPLTVREGLAYLRALC